MNTTLAAVAGIGQSGDGHFRSLFNANTLGMFTWDLSGKVLEANEAMLCLLGYSKEEAEEGLHWGSMLPREAIEPIESTLHEVRKGCSCPPIQLEFVRKDGKRVPVLFCANRLGYSTQGLGVVVDMSGRKAVEESWLAQVALLDRASNPIIVRNLSDEIIYFNSAAQKTFGWNTSKVIGRSECEVLSIDPQLFSAAKSLLMRTGQWSGEFTAVNYSGAEVALQVHWSTISDSGVDGEKVILTMAYDLTETKRMQAEVLRAQRIENIGKLASGIAHDLNNIFVPLNLCAAVLEDYITSPGGKEILSTISTTVQRGSALAQQILSFAKGSEGKKLLVEVKNLTTELEMMVKQTFPKTIEFQVHNRAEHSVVSADPSQLHQVLLNLCVNSRDAMPEGGLLRIQLSNVELDEIFAAMNPGLRAGNYLKIAVSDTGCGIPLEYQKKIFEPFFTTKQRGNGTGLGLASVANIVRSHGGTVSFQSEAGKGTRFEILLPLAEAQTGPTPEKRMEPGMVHNETVLLIEDEPEVQKVLEQGLRRIGFSVITATNGANGLATYAREQSKIDLVITDMNMPVMDGKTTIGALREIQPDCRILAISGSSLAELNSYNVQSAGVEFLQKPFTMPEICNRVEKLLVKAPGATGANGIGLN